MRKVSRVTTPRLPPPPPFNPQNRSELVQALAIRTSPSAVTTSASSRPAAAKTKALGEAAEAAALNETSHTYGEAAPALDITAGLGGGAIGVQPQCSGANRQSRLRRGVAALRHERVVHDRAVQVPRPDKQRVGRAGGALIAVAAPLHDEAQAVLAGEAHGRRDVLGAAGGDAVGTGRGRPGVGPAAGLGEPGRVADIPGILQTLEQGLALGTRRGGAAGIERRLHLGELATDAGLERVPLRRRRPGRIAGTVTPERVP